MCWVGIKWIRFIPSLPVYQTRNPSRWSIWISSMLGPFDKGLFGIYLFPCNCKLHPSKVIPFIPLPNKIWMVLYMDEGFVFK